MSFLKSPYRFNKKVVKSVIIFTLFCTLFAGAPKRSYAFLGIGDISFDPIEDISGIISSVADGFSAAFGALQTAFDSLQFSKDFALDGVANLIAKQIIRGLTAQTVNWINSGFKGNPAFVTDPSKFFLNIGDNVAANYLSKNGVLNQLCSPFKAQVRLQLVKNYLSETSTNYSCTLGKIEQNYNAFTQDFNQGGWDSWFTITQDNRNNPYGAYIDQKNELYAQIGNKQQTKIKELDRGMGFLNFKKCVQRESTPPVLEGCDEVEEANGLCTKPKTTSDASRNPDACGSSAEEGGCDIPQVDTPDESGADTSETAPDAPGAPKCLKTETVTPGSVISGQLSKALGSTWDSLGAADEINEIVGALMTQMVQHVVGGIGNGLRGLAQDKDPSQNSRSLLQQMLATTTGQAFIDDKTATDGITKGIPAEVKPGSTALTPDIPDRGTAGAQSDSEMGGHLTPAALGCVPGAVGCVAN